MIRAGFPSNNCAFGNVLHRDGSGAYDCESADRHPGPDKGIRANPRTVMNRDRRFNERHIGHGVIMRPCAQMRILGNGYLLAHDYPAK